MNKFHEIPRKTHRAGQLLYFTSKGDQAHFFSKSNLVHRFSSAQMMRRPLAFQSLTKFLSAQIQVLIGKTEKRGETFKSSITQAEPLAQMGGEMAQLVVDLQLADNVKEIVSINIMRDYQYHY